MLEIKRNAPLEKILQYLNKEELFKHRWGWKLPSNKYTAQLPSLESNLERLLEPLEKYLHLDYVLGSFDFEIRGSQVFFDNEHRLYFPTVKREEGDFCIIDYIKEMNNKKLALFMCTCGKESMNYAKALANQKYLDYFYTDGLLSELAEALAEYVEHQIKEKHGYSKGKRYSPGVQSLRKIGQSDYFPLDNQKTIFSLLEADKLGMQLTDTCFLIPEKSVSGIFVSSEKAKWL
jgi:5-methyltetrahydrofolate--homocysteine methyltransferase